MSLEKLIKLIEQWAIDRGLDKKGTVEGQLIKTAEEVAELIIGISKDDINVIKDSIGDVFVTLVIGNLITNVKVMPYGNKVEFKERIKYGGNLNSKTISSKYNITRSLIDNLDLLMLNGSYKTGVSKLWMDLNGICLMYGLTPSDCIESAYKEIADRKGVVKNGSFVKASDLEKQEQESDLDE